MQLRMMCADLIGFLQGWQPERWSLKRRMISSIRMSRRPDWWAGCSSLLLRPALLSKRSLKLLLSSGHDTFLVSRDKIRLPVCGNSHAASRGGLCKMQAALGNCVRLQPTWLRASPGWQLTRGPEHGLPARS